MRSVTQIVRTAAGHRVMGLYASPRDPNWAELMEAFDNLMEWLFRCLKLPPGLLDHRRGRYATIGVGYGFGGGRRRPGSYVNSAHNARLLQQALGSPVIHRIARYVDQGLLALFPALHSLCTNLDRSVVDVDNPEIQRSFQNCCYPACHFNLHSSSTAYHSDYWNYIGGMCAIVSGGKFDCKRSAHFIAWSLGLAFEFPPGTAIFVPSAAVPHSNTPLAKHERRHSLAFFLPAGLVRWYHNGFRSDKEFRDLAAPSELQAWLDYRKNLGEVALDLLQDTSTGS
ncbi:hypothetical protein BT96DRAFT_812948 [Gymnopus androsaceus JB14]|uniref:Prolyl 4-hydroxylase alpha subunit Fe(2+) 2OG dioxygenase domain-containing protein n=1 Tax=Gymnopus androsaceus JB14 TaxID=1447944 RepID=A0A6A4I370_9AGAR|nr:hypothetical protein BT96DRAFT_812948 [Gymnopus androsaceus JB14]